MGKHEGTLVSGLDSGVTTGRALRGREVENELKRMSGRENPSACPRCTVIAIDSQNQLLNSCQRATAEERRRDVFIAARQQHRNLATRVYVCAGARRDLVELFTERKYQHIWVLRAATATRKLKRTRAVDYIVIS